ncbi:TIGR03087 family PEP-CTERM/XrtA system glycosyltransferase [Photobacterium japonica]|uniref:TIGR03087 family PEP-CTERM/XrtA system glycosyltransferase n=1 Tax=Photobacterium japonica TaxID=2910235 RepID=UPI003D0BF062
MKEPLLYLCHRIPFPPNKGDKITTYNVLKYLQQHYDIHLGCFVDDAFDTRYQDDVAQFCVSSHCIPLSRAYSKLKGLTALLKGEPITLPFYARQAMQQWVDRTLAQHSIRKAFVYSGCMAQYVIPHSAQLHTVMHFADIDSDKWRQYALKSHGIMKAIYQREHKTLEEYEIAVAHALNVSCFVTQTETDAFKALLEPRVQDKIMLLENGLDSDYFSPSANTTLGESYPLESDNYIVFTGAMDYWANADAVTWFTQQVWPLVIQTLPEAKLYLVGSSPGPNVEALAEQTGVIVTGRVEDVRPYLQHAKAAIAPMQIARGVQNKLLEAMAMAKPIIVSPLTIEGMEDYPTEHLAIADAPEEIARWLINKLQAPAIEAHSSREWIEQHYSWEAKLKPLLGYLSPPPIGEVTV